MFIFHHYSRYLNLNSRFVFWSVLVPSSRDRVRPLVFHHLSVNRLQFQQQQQQNIRTRRTWALLQPRVKGQTGLSLSHLLLSFSSFSLLPDPLSVSFPPLFRPLSVPCVLLSSHLLQRTRMMRLMSLLLTCKNKYTEFMSEESPLPPLPPQLINKHINCQFKTWDNEATSPPPPPPPKPEDSSDLQQWRPLVSAWSILYSISI